ncbi:RsbRD N-terminal domain-containing protein [Amycolatopsis sp. NPDC004368]
MICGSCWCPSSRSSAADGDSIDGERFGEAEALLAELSRNRARQGFSPSETASSVFALRRAVFELTETDDDPALFREEISKEQAEQLLELTTPVINLWDGVLAVPLIGTLDSARSQVVMEKLLETLVETGSEQVIVDIMGVFAVGTPAAPAFSPSWATPLRRPPRRCRRSVAWTTHPRVRSGFLGSSGITSLVAVRGRAAHENTTVAVASGNRQVVRVLDLLGLTEELSVRGDLAAAVHAVSSAG